MSAPARMKSGMAISGKLVAPWYITIARLGRLSVPWLTMMATTAAMPSATAIGTLISTRAMTPKKIRDSVMSARPRRHGRASGRALHAARRAGRAPRR
ncbi:hypothetical protein D3C83_70380 [compost metagenome]